jgi:hypothetical protein
MNMKSGGNIEKTDSCNLDLSINEHTLLWNDLPGFFIVARQSILALHLTNFSAIEIWCSQAKSDYTLLAKLSPQSRTSDLL